MSGTACILSVNVARATPLQVPGGRTVLSAIGKQPVHGPVAASALGLAGDEQADLSVHGGIHKAVYAYPAEHLPFWQQARQQAGLPATPLPPGLMGENLLLQGLLEEQLWLGDTLRFTNSACVLRITAPREPCFKFTAVMGLRDAARTMVQQARCGFYLAVQTPGLLQAGMAITVEPGNREYSVADAIRHRWAKHRNG